ncbi:restriction endonuclease [Endozoicomonas lisbonensis]|uniref:Restriction endonuclease type IV Mrr domain-containing protein n=1 Tax=Endozoicomonas lisbonensis TaxID=3120522 RepID=A0ABV2SEV9_9GAMM
MKDSEAELLNVDFKEIPQGNLPNGDQDAFELFARDLFEALGFKIVKEPSRGNDDRKDIIISEIREGEFGSNEFNYLVSCKHYSHNKISNKSVGNSDEKDIVGRMRNNGCKGFIGFYSTISSDALQRELKQAKDNNPADFLEIKIFDRAKIVDLLHKNEKTLLLYKRYFPKSYRSQFINEINSGVYPHKPKISCIECDIDIIELMSGYIIELTKSEPKIRDGEKDWDYPIEKVQEIIFSCEDCIKSVHKKINKKYKNWPYQIRKTDITYFTDPKFFIDNLMRNCSFMRAYNDGYTDHAYRKWNNFSRAMFYFVSRPMKVNKRKAGPSSIDRYEL